MKNKIIWIGISIIAFIAVMIILIINVSNNINKNRESEQTREVQFLEEENIKIDKELEELDLELAQLVEQLENKSEGEDKDLNIEEINKRIEELKEKQNELKNIKEENIKKKNEIIVQKNNNEIKDNSKPYKKILGLNGEMPEYSLQIGNPRTMSSWDTGFIDFSEENYEIQYISEDESILKAYPTGKLEAIKMENTYLYVNLIDKETGEKVDSIKCKVIIDGYEASSEEAKELNKKMIDDITGFYWYLDGYEYAYIRATVIDWDDHQLLNWESKFIDIENNQFVATEQTKVEYRDSDNIHNKFLINPLEYVYFLYVEYNMHVSGEKLYITLGGKTYSFTKYGSEKEIEVKVNVSKTNVAFTQNETEIIEASYEPFFSNSYLYVMSSDMSVVSFLREDLENGKIKVTLYADEPGDAEISIIDNTSSSYVNVPVHVKKIYIPTTGIIIDQSDFSMLRGESKKLTATVLPDNASERNVSWESSNPDVVEVDQKGNANAIKKGQAKITAFTENGDYSVSCNVEVSNPELTASGGIGYEVRILENSLRAGINASISANGGTGIYTDYYIKLYKDGNLIGERDEPSIFVPGYGNGQYYIEYYVVDSDGNEVDGSSSFTITM